MSFEIIGSSFTATPDNGASPLRVQFYETSFVRERIVESGSQPDRIIESGSQPDRVVEQGY